VRCTCTGRAFRNNDHVASEEIRQQFSELFEMNRSSDIPEGAFARWPHGRMAAGPCQATVKGGGGPALHPCMNRAHHTSVKRSSASATLRSQMGAQASVGPGSPTVFFPG
jgi:hypothetical protein